MFRTFIYIDEDKLRNYSKQLQGKNSATPKTMTQKRSAGLSVGTQVAELSAALETSISSDIEKDLSFEYDCFESALTKLDGEDYFDCVLNSDYDITTVPHMKIIRICNRFEIPETFDMVNMMEQFKPMLMENIETKSSGAQEALEQLFGNASADIPFIVELDDVTVAGKLNTKYLCEKYASLEDYSDQDVYMLCKVVGMMCKEKVEIFDPLKDFIHIPRSMRRKMPSDDNSLGMEKIIVDGPVLKVEAIAIYK